VLEAMGVPADATERTLNLIVDSARSLGFLREIKDDLYVQIDTSNTPHETQLGETSDDPDGETTSDHSGVPEKTAAPEHEDTVPSTLPSDLKTNRRVFITHGKNKKIVDQLKELLTFGNFEPIVSVERESVSKPVPDKVLDDMRSCGAAVIHVGTEQKLLDQDGNEHRVINQNVLIEIGAAMMRYGRNFILLVEEYTTLPSNLQGLYEVRYSGDELDYPATMKLLKAFNEFKS
jgi:predicted nucleotide-binding protein